MTLFRQEMLERTAQPHLTHEDDDDQQQSDRKRSHDHRRVMHGNFFSGKYTERKSAAEGRRKLCDVRQFVGFASLGELSYPLYFDMPANWPNLRRPPHAVFLDRAA